MADAEYHFKPEAVVRIEELLATVNAQTLLRRERIEQLTADVFSSNNRKRQSLCLLEEEMCKKKKNEGTDQCRPLSRIITTVEDGTSRCFALAKSIMKKHLESAFDSEFGIPWHMCAPFANGPACNVLRPAVVRTFYGKDQLFTGKDNSDYVSRFEYGGGSGVRSVGVDPLYLKTKPMTLAMHDLGEELLAQVREKQGDCGSIDLTASPMAQRGNLSKQF
jgi:hypothetical protein